MSWDPDMQEAREQPPYILLSNEYFTVYEKGRQRLRNGQQPAQLQAKRGIRGRTWRAYENRMNEEPVWERAERYRRIMQEKGYNTIRALARATGEDHSRVARVMKILDLPEAVLAALRKHAGDVRIRTHFTEKRLRQMAKGLNEAATLREIERRTM